MADIPNTWPITIRDLKPLGPRLPRLKIGASLIAVSGLIGDAFNMAYVAPYAGLRRQAQIIQDDDLEGRDPSW
ncbi:hypothetical protein AB4144_19170 [Rhizobiaceae sp. 2RAB30]